MTWNDVALLESELRHALNSFNWIEAETICAGIIGRIKSDPELIPESSARRLLQYLRRKRCFQLMTALAEALLQSGLQTPQIRRQYAQALIDQGALTAAEMILQFIIHESHGAKEEELEARGLVGRIYKQIYVNNNDPNSPRNRTNLERAINQYLCVYRLGPEQYLWHGINAVALLERARRDNFQLYGLPDAKSIAMDILAELEKRERNTIELGSAWDIAIAFEAYVALGRYQDAADAALRFIDSDADAFEINSTFRQLTEVWQLNSEEPPGNLLIPICKAGHLNKPGASATLYSKQLNEYISTGGRVHCNSSGFLPPAVPGEVSKVDSAIKGLEALLGADRTHTVRWYKKGLEQCNSIARVDRPDGQGHGTGWLVNASEFFPGKQGVLLLTNAHVVSNHPDYITNRSAIHPKDTKIEFQMLGENGRFDVEAEVFWTSPPAELDATFLVLKGEPKIVPLVIHDRPVQMTDPAPRLYIIGHPGGRDLEFSLDDSHLVSCNDTFIHYRTPTEPGSSGSPVFESDDWRVVALHHSGSKTMKRLDGQGTYEANEGIAIQALKRSLNR